MKADEFMEKVLSGINDRAVYSKQINTLLNTINIEEADASTALRFRNTLISFAKRERSKRAKKRGILKRIFN